MTNIPKCLVIGGPRHGEVVVWDRERLEVVVIDRCPLFTWRDVEVSEMLPGRSFCYRRVRVAARPVTVRWALIPDAIPPRLEMTFILESVFNMAAGRPLVMGEG